MRTIAPAPLLKPFVDPDQNLASREYIQWFSSLGDSLTGRWGLDKRNLAKTNATTPDLEYISYKGRELRFLFVWEDPITFASDTITLDRSDLTMLPGMLEVWDGTALSAGAYCSEDTITLPDLTTAARCVIQGSVLTKVRN